MTWPQILKYRKMIKFISLKYSSDPDLAEDVSQEVMVRLFENKKLKIKNFKPETRDAAIRTTIRNQVLKVLGSRKVGRWSVESLDEFRRLGYQIDTNGNIIIDPAHDIWNINHSSREFDEIEDN